MIYTSSGSSWRFADRPAAIDAPSRTPRIKAGRPSKPPSLRGPLSMKGKNERIDSYVSVRADYCSCVRYFVLPLPLKMEFSVHRIDRSIGGKKEGTGLQGSVHSKAYLSLLFADAIDRDGQTRHTTACLTLVDDSFGRHTIDRADSRTEFRLRERCIAILNCRVNTPYSRTQRRTPVTVTKVTLLILSDALNCGFMIRHVLLPLHRCTANCLDYATSVGRRVAKRSLPTCQRYIAQSSDLFAT